MSEPCRSCAIPRSFFWRGLTCMCCWPFLRRLALHFLQLLSTASVATAAAWVILGWLSYSEEQGLQKNLWTSLKWSPKVVEGWRRLNLWSCEACQHVWGMSEPCRSCAIPRSFFWRGLTCMCCWPFLRRLALHFLQLLSTASVATAAAWVVLGWLSYSEEQGLQKNLWTSLKWSPKVPNIPIFPRPERTNLNHPKPSGWLVAV